jgi:hypothetical protein
MGLEGEEAADFVAKRVREPEVMGKRCEFVDKDEKDRYKPSKEAKKLLAEWQKREEAGKAKRTAAKGLLV